MAYFKKYNLTIGWLAFAVSSIVYLMTMEPTASLWDCAEFIATSYKMEVGHPPGAPLFMMIARVFAIFAPSPQSVGVMINAMSSLASGFTVLFLFWSITHIAAKLYGKKREELTRSQVWTVMGAGLIGSLSYAFLDTIWFSAVEAEVYAMSSFFTAIVFWAILMWEDVADQPHSNRWLILIAYLMGLSTGVHILNLLAIPAIVLVYYFKKTPKVTAWGVVKATMVSGLILIGLNNIIIPYSIALGAWVDKIFVNGIGLPANSGMVFYVVALFVLCGWAIYYTHTKGKVLANTIILCTTVILMGYSSYASVVIRASVDIPMNSNNPSNPYALLSLLNRDQYGSRPLLYGQQYSSPVSGTEYKKMTYLGTDEKYNTTKIPVGYEFPAEFKSLFPRMWRHDKAEGYKSWVDKPGRMVPYGSEMIEVPTAGQNVEFFLKYQTNYMFWRYFLWNFVGRQSDIQGNGDVMNGNWLSGVKPIDAIYLGPQSNLPSEMADNKGRNRYFFLPFLLGLAGLIYHLNRNKRDFTVVLAMFVMMGIALVVYFNTAPSEPRERDYVFAGAFYAFSIWIGIGVLWVRDLITKIAKKETVAGTAGAIIVCSAVPVILCQQNWDDHDRSHRYIARDIGCNFLESTLPNSIIMNFGDNDTFPLWYSQEVENVRPDVRIMNLSYLGGDWYIDQMRVKANEADTVPFSLPRKKYIASNNDHLYIDDLFKKPIEIKDAFDWVASDDERTKVRFTSGEMADYLPSSKLLLPVNKENAIACGVVKPEDAQLMVDTIMIDLGTRRSLNKSEMMVFDMLANFDWKRPIYFTSAYHAKTYGLQDYLQFDGYAYRVVPIYTPDTNRLETGRVDKEYLYPLLMDKFRFGNIHDSRVYTDYFTQYNLNSSDSRLAYARLSLEFLRAGDTVRATEVMDRGMELLPLKQLRHSYLQSTSVITAYYQAGAWEKGNAVLDDYARVLEEYITYFIQFKGRKVDMVVQAFATKRDMLEGLHELAYSYNQDESAQKIRLFFESFGARI